MDVRQTVLTKEIITADEMGQACDPITRVGAKTATLRRAAHGRMATSKASMLCSGTQIIIEGWRKHNNTWRPHSALGYGPPAQDTIVAMDQRSTMQ